MEFMDFFAQVVFEIFCEFTSGLIKSKPKQMPNDVEYNEEFSVYYSKLLTFIVLTFFGLAFVGFLLLGHFINDNDAEYIMYIIAACFLILFLISSFLFSIKCYFTTEKIVKTTLFIFKKEILWQDIILLRIIEKTDNTNVTLALYNKNKKCVYTVESNYKNAWLLVKMVEHKQIKIKKEKDLSIWKINKLD